MEAKKIIFSCLAMMAFFTGSLALFMFVACSGPAPQTVNEQPATETVAESEPEFDSLSLVFEPEDTEPVVVTSAVTTSHTTASSYASSSSSADYSLSDDDYWENKRKHSPNDNYLLGFDEDVDDVHDMELYIEDY